MSEPQGSITEDARKDLGSEKAPVKEFFKGAGMAQDFIGGAEQIARGDWTEGLLDYATGAFDLASNIKGGKNPVEVLVSMGLGWVLEHLSPLNDMLDAVTGNQDELELTVTTWNQVSKHVQETAQSLADSTKNDCATWSGQSVDQYRLFVQDRLDLYRGISDGAKGVSSLVDICKTVLNVVRTIIRDLIADVCTQVILIIARYPPPAYPVALTAEIVPVVVQSTNTGTRELTRCARVLQRGRDLLDSLRSLFHDATRYLAEQGFLKGMAKGPWSVLVSATGGASEGLGSKMVTDTVKEMTKTVTGGIAKEVGSTGSTDHDKQGPWHESEAKREHDRRETKVVEPPPPPPKPSVYDHSAREVFPRQGGNRISGTLDE